MNGWMDGWMNEWKLYHSIHTKSQLALYLYTSIDGVESTMNTYRTDAMDMTVRLTTLPPV